MWSASRPSHFTPGERTPVTHWIGGWVGPRTNLDDMEKRKFLTLLGLELRPLGHPVAIPTVLSHPSPFRGANGNMWPSSVQFTADIFHYTLETPTSWAVSYAIQLVFFFKFLYFTWIVSENKLEDLSTATHQILIYITVQCHRHAWTITTALFAMPELHVRLNCATCWWCGSVDWNRWLHFMAHTTSSLNGDPFFFSCGVR
jgi:hypothetical protein